MIGTGTRLICLLGSPVAHSRSPAMHNAAFAELGLDMAYLAFDVGRENLRDAIVGLKALGFAGGNITAPHKQAAVSLVDALEDVASRIGAINTLVYREGILEGHNTDIHGFLMALELGWGRSPKGVRALVLGAGGAARAVVAGLVEAGAEQVHIYNRTYQRAVGLCEDASMWGPTRCAVVREDRLGEVAAEVDLVVNTIPLGKEDGIKFSPLPVDTIGESHVVMDLNYSGGQTTILRCAADKGALTIDGREMLVQQAVRSFELWTDRAAPVKMMRERAENY